MNIYPEVSLCFSGEYSNTELKKINGNFIAREYMYFLKERYCDPLMVDLDFERVTRNLKDHLLYTCAQSFYGSPCNLKMETTSHVYFWGPKCLFFNVIPDRRLFASSVWINSSLFLNNGVRPPYGYKFVVSLSYPRQMLRFPFHNGLWDIRKSMENIQ